MACLSRDTGDEQIESAEAEMVSKSLSASEFHQLHERSFSGVTSNEDNKDEASLCSQHNESSSQ